MDAYWGLVIGLAFAGVLFILLLVTLVVMLIRWLTKRNSSGES